MGGGWLTYLWDGSYAVVSCFEIFTEGEGFDVGEKDAVSGFAGCFCCRSEDKDGGVEVFREMHSEDAEDYCGRLDIEQSKIKSRRCFLWFVGGTE